MPAFHSTVRVEARTLIMHKNQPDWSVIEIAAKLGVSTNSVRCVLYRHKLTAPSFFGRRAIVGKIKAKP